MNDFERARQKYRPDLVKVAFVAESPPREDSERFFYFEEVFTGDSLFLEVMKALYEDARGGAKTVRPRKPEFLNRFRDDGFYLIDASQDPIAGESPAVKRRYIRSGLEQLQQSLTEIQHPDLKVILISALVYEICSQPLRQAGWNVLNTEMIDFPGFGRQKKFQTKFPRVMERI